MRPTAAHLVGLALLAATACGGSPEPEPVRGDLVFVVMGDAPYNWFEERRFEHLIYALNADSLDWVIHVGDIYWKRCSDGNMRQQLGLLQRIRHPVVYTPGDNEWTDCWGRREGGFEPTDRLRSLREILYPRPGLSLGGEPMRVVYQASDTAWAEFVEHQRWTRGGIVFATVHLVGSRNGMDDFPGRSEADDSEVRRRTEAAAAWLREAFAEARSSRGRAVFLALHAEMGFYDPDDGYRRAFEPFLKTLEEEVATFDGPVILAHGDHHEYTVDSPLVDRRTGRSLDNFTRLQVMGSPDVGWVRVAVDTVGPTFRFAPRRIPGWKLW